MQFKYTDGCNQDFIFLCHALDERVFILDKYRGRGISKELMEKLEASARQKGFTYFILESGEPLAAAMKLYRSIGYYVIPNYGQYVAMPESVCMKKKL